MQPPSRLPERSKPVQASRYILVIDDEPQIHRFLRPTLMAAGFLVESAMTGAQALQKFRAALPELIILDLGLADMEGRAVLATIRATSTVPIIILSARDSETEKVGLLNAGADDYLSKPFGVGELIARINTALRHAMAAS